MSVGGQTVGFVTVDRVGDPGYLGLVAKTTTVVPFTGVSFQSVSAAETPEGQTDVTTERWQLVAPPSAEPLAVRSTGELIYDGDTFQVDGPISPRHDLSGTRSHVMIMYKRQAG